MKSFKSFILSAALISSVAFHSPRSEAMIGLATIPGSVFMVPIIIGSAFMIAPGMENGFVGSTGWLAIAGVIVFDKSSHEVEFKEISLANAKAIGLTEKEVYAYNTELERINLGLSELNSSLLNTPKERIEEVKEEVLAQFQSEISQDAFSALDKVMRYSVSR